jgi:transcription initiation factor IIE alpha subunit
MSSAFESTEMELKKVRERLRKMSDDKLIAFGKNVRELSGRESVLRLTRDCAIGRGASGVEAQTSVT